MKKKEKKIIRRNGLCWLLLLLELCTCIRNRSFNV